MRLKNPNLGHIKHKGQTCSSKRSRSNVNINGSHA